MKSSHRGFALPLAIALVAVLIGSGAYLYLSGGGAVTAEDQIAAQAEELRARARAEREKLSDMQTQFLSTRPLNSALFNGFQRLRSAIFNKADKLFNTDIGSSLELKFRAGSNTIAASIIAERKKIERILDTWENVQASALKVEIKPETINDMIDDAEDIQEYLEELQEIVENLTPENSGLTESEINLYEEAVEAALEDVEEVIEELEEALEADTSNPAPTTPGSVFQNPQTPAQTPTQNTPTTPTTPIVTPQDIQNQQNIVDEIEAQLAALAAQLAALQAQNNQPAQNLPDASTNYTSSQQNYIPVWSFPAQDLPSKPIIVTPGSSGFIEGENTD